MKRLMLGIMSVIFILSMYVVVFAEVGEIRGSNLIQSAYSHCSWKSMDSNKQLRSVDLSESIDLGGGDTFKKKFKTERWWFLEDHNAFKVSLDNVTGSYKVMILGETGYFYTSKEYTGKSVTITVTNAKPNKNYTVAVINTSSGNSLSADLVIKSFKE